MSALLNEMGQLGKLPLYKIQTPNPYIQVTDHRAGYLDSVPSRSNLWLPLTTWLGLYIPCPSHRQIYHRPATQKPDYQIVLSHWANGAGLIRAITDACPVGGL